MRLFSPAVMLYKSDKAFLMVVVFEPPGWVLIAMQKKYSSNLQKELCL
jgi:hypothetical protein